MARELKGLQEIGFLARFVAKVAFTMETGAVVHYL